MNKLIKIAVSFVLIIGVILYSFAQFGHALVDYSLESLGVALKATDQTVTQQNILGKHVYQNVLKGMILDEAGKENMNFENLLLLEAASRSLGQPEELAGTERARFYIEQVKKNKKEHVSSWEFTKYAVDQFILRVRYLFSSLVAYFKSKMMPQKEQAFQISDTILLNRAQEMEKSGDLNNAKNLYKQYLEIYRNRPDRGLVSLSLANILMIQRDWKGTKKLLDKVRGEFFNREEGRVAMSMLKGMDLLKRKSKDIQRFESELEEVKGTNDEGRVLFDLGLTYLSIQNLERAEHYFKLTRENDDPKYGRRAAFYLGWVYKLSSKYEIAAEMLENILAEKGELQEEMRLALYAQLADIYMQMGDLEKARFNYQRLAESAKKADLETGVDMKSWVGLADIEQGVVSVQKGDNRSLDRLLYRLSIGGFDDASFMILKDKLMQSKGMDLRTQAFRKLLVGKTHDAIDLFERNKVVNPEDAYTYSGLATADLVLRDMDKAYRVAQEAIRFAEDEYTAALLGYVYGKMGKTEEAIDLYHTALRYDQNYVPARYNLTCEYLNSGQYEVAYQILTLLHQDFKNSNNGSIRAKILNNIGVALWGMGRKKEAYDNFKKALLINPRFIRAEENMKLIRLGETPDTVTEEDAQRAAG